MDATAYSPMSNCRNLLEEAAAIMLYIIHIQKRPFSSRSFVSYYSMQNLPFLLDQSLRQNIAVHKLPIMP